MRKKKGFIAFTSQYVLSNPGAGAWTAAIYETEGNSCKPIKHYNNFHLETTPNYLDLEAIVVLISKVDKAVSLTIVHDSSYIDNILTKWIFKWESKDFLAAGNKPIQNAELVKSLSKLRKKRDVSFIYTGNTEKPIYNLMCNHTSRIMVYSRIHKKTPADIAKILSSK